MSATAAQTAANKQNAKFSTGPRTEQGKQRSSQNARKHGLTSAHLIVSESERPAFDDMRESLLASLLPVGELEFQLFDQILASSWNIRRCRIAETQVGLDSPGIDPLLDPNAERTLARIDTYLRRNERAFHRALKDLRELQTERSFRETLIPVLAGTNKPDLSPLVSFPTIRKGFLDDIIQSLRANHLPQTARFARAQ